MKTPTECRLSSWVLLCALMLLAATASAADKLLDLAPAAQRQVALTGYFAVLEDPDRKLTLEDLTAPTTAHQFRNGLPEAEALSFGFTRSAYWLRLTLRNTQDQALQRLLEIRYPLLSSIQLHQQLENGAYASSETGAAAPFSTRPYPNRFFVFPLTVPGQSTQTIYLRIESASALLVPASLWEPGAFHVHERNDYAGQTLYFGMAAAIVLFNLLLFIALRDSVYLLYTVFVTFTALTIAASNGFGKEFLWPAATLWSDIAINVSGSLTLAALLLLMRHMLETRIHVPRLDRVILAFVVVLALSPIAYAVSLRAFVVPSIVLVSAAGLLILVVGAYCALILSQKIALLFMVAVSMWMLGSLVVGLKTMSLLPANFLTMNGYQIGATLEMMLLAFVLAYRFNQIRREATELVQQTNAGLEHRLREREAELRESHLRLRESEHREILRQERQRLMQDMHDGMGSALTSALRVVEQGRLDSIDVAQVLKGCIDDLKLAIDSMEPVEADLLLLLAMLRFRLGSRLENSGITLHWGVQDIPALEWLEPRYSLHILRILQEAFTNIVKHARATEIRLSTHADANSVAIVIADNGHGFDVATALGCGGKGLATQRSRAQAIGAQVTWESDRFGTRVTLRLPISRPGNGSDDAVEEKALQAVAIC